jgi:putative membrane protein
MWQRWLDDSGEQALTAAVSHIEAVSAVEVAIAIRHRARVWVHVPFLVGAIAAWATLAFMMFSDPAFALWSFVVDPFVVGVLAGWAASVTPSMVRWLTPHTMMRRAVSTAARATFVERGVHLTRGRTGVLVYCALAERMSVVVGDHGVTAVLPAATVAAYEAQIERAIAHGANATADAIAAMAPVFAAALPRLADDANELADVVHHDAEQKAWW